MMADIQVFRVIQGFGVISRRRDSPLYTRSSPWSVLAMRRMVMELIRSAIRPTAIRTSGLSDRRV